MFNISFPKIVAFITSKNAVEPEATNDVTIWLKRVACWISKATRAHAHAH